MTYDERRGRVSGPGSMPDNPLRELIADVTRDSGSACGLVLLVGSGYFGGGDGAEIASSPSAWEAGAGARLPGLLRELADAIEARNLDWNWFGKPEGSPEN